MQSCRKASSWEQLEMPQGRAVPREQHLQGGHGGCQDPRAAGLGYGEHRDWAEARGTAGAGHRALGNARVGPGACAPIPCTPAPARSPPAQAAPGRKRQEFALAGIGHPLICCY